MATSPLAWPQPTDQSPRLAAVNAFGIGGLNIHVVVSEPPTAASTAALIRQNAPRAAQPDDHAVAIIGRGVILPGAKSIAEFWELLTSGRDATSDVTPDRWNPAFGYRPGSLGPWYSPTKRGGFITDYAYDWQKHKVPPKQVANANPLQFMLLDAADQALAESGYDRRPFDRRRTAVVVGTVFGGDFGSHLEIGLTCPELQQSLRQVLEQRGHRQDRVEAVSEQLGSWVRANTPALHDETGSFTSSTLASRLSKTLDLMGGAMAIDAGGASSLAALAAATDLLSSGSCEMVLCAGGQRSMDLCSFEILAASGLLTGDQPRAPFDSAASGFVPGEGVAVVLLKRLADARRDNDRILGIVRGIGASADGVRLSDAFADAARQAQHAAGITPDDITMIEGGSGVPRLDAQLATAAATVFSAERGKPLWLGSLAAQIGHLQGAHGMAALVKASLEIEHRQLVPTVGLKTSTAPQTLSPVTQTISLVSEAGKPIVAAVVAHSQHGLAYEVLLASDAPRPSPATKIDRPAAPVRTTPMPIAQVQTMPTNAPVSVAITPQYAISGTRRIVRLGAPDTATLWTKLATLRTAPDRAWTSTAARFVPTDRARLAIVAQTPDDLAGKLKLAEEQGSLLAARGALAEQGIFIRELTDKPLRVAGVFAGQGSQYPDMLRELIGADTAAAAAVRQADAAMAAAGFPSFLELTRTGNDALGTDVWTTQVSVLLADSIIFNAMTVRGIALDCITAHSFGEFGALVAAGAWSLEQAIVATRARAESIRGSRHARGALLSTTASPEIVDALAVRHQIAVYVTSHNGPEQTVLGGTHDAVVAMSTLLQKAGYPTRSLRVPCPFHTPLMADVKPTFRQALEALTIVPPHPLVEQRQQSLCGRAPRDPSQSRRAAHAARALCRANCATGGRGHHAVH